MDFVKTKLCWSTLLPLSEFLLRRLERVQFAASSVVLGYYVKNFRDILKIRWLPINERRDLNLLKSSFKTLHNTEAWPGIKRECRKEPPSGNPITLAVPADRNRHKKCVEASSYNDVCSTTILKHFFFPSFFCFFFFRHSIFSISIKCFQLLLSLMFGHFS